MKILQSLIIWCFIVSSHVSYAQVTNESNQAGTSFEKLEELSLSDILDMNVTVTSSGKQSQRLSDVPESMWVISAEEIRRSGATSLAELFRLVPGMDVVQSTPGHFTVTARIHEHFVASQVLFLLDSRPTYFGFFRNTVLMSLPVVLEEIERIEVILGPGATLFGSNAVRGVVNIITKNPDKDVIDASIVWGSKVGDDKTSFANGRAAAYLAKRFSKKFGGSLSAEFLQMEPWKDGQYPVVGGDFKTTRSTKGQLKLDAQLKENSRLVFASGFSLLDSDYIPFTRNTNATKQVSGDLRFTSEHLLIDNDFFEARVLARYATIDMDIVLSDLLPSVTLDDREFISNMNLLYRFTIGKATTTIGVDGEYGSFSNELLETNKDLSFISAFIDERIAFTDWLTLNAGLRFENQFSDAKTIQSLSPQISVVIKPAKRHVLRFSYRQAFVYPTIFDRFGNMSISNGALVIYAGNEMLEPIKVSSLEGGYQLLISQKLSFKIDMYYSRFSNLTALEQNASGNPLITFDHVEGTKIAYGFEAAATYSPNESYRFKLAYANSNYEEPYYEDIPYTPAHKVYVSASANPIPKLEIDLYVYFMSFYYGLSIDGNNTPLVVNPNELVDVRVAYKITKNLSAFAVAKNLIAYKWKDTFIDGALDSESQLSGSDIIGSKFMIGLQAYF